MATVQLVEIECGTCGIVHCIPESLYNRCKREGGFWHCPNGHSRGWSEGSLRAENNRLKQQIAERDDAVRRAEQEALQAQRALKCAQKRTAAGVCPCCSRTVGQLARHIKTQHPEYAKEHLGDGGTLPDENKIIPIRRRKTRHG